MKDLLDAIFNFAKSGSLSGAVNLKDLGKAARTAAIVGAIAALGSVVTDAATLDYGSSEVFIVMGLGFAIDFIRRMSKDNS